MRYLLIFTVLAFFSCNNEKVLQLPEIENAKVTEVLDVSSAYIFYDETQLDSTLFNRKNLISTTNWLVNVDKRLTLKQVIPHIQYLQNKRKKTSMHKNENAKNYFTCNDTSIKNLGFLEFTDVEYLNKIKSKNLDIHKSITDNSFKKQKTDSTKFINQLSGLYKRNIDLKFGFEKGSYLIFDDSIIKNNAEVKTEYFIDYLKYKIKEERFANTFIFTLHFSKHLSFQDYINIKSELHKLGINMITINTNEFFY